MPAPAPASRPQPPLGRVVFVGAGPGAPDLLTIRALESLRTADVIVHDQLVPRAILDLASPAAEVLLVPRGSDACGDADPGEVAGRLLARLAREGRTVVRLKGGDPSVFARLVEELEPLRDAGIGVEFVPGVTAALAAAAAAGVPLTSRSAASSLTIVTGHAADDKTDGIDFCSLATVPGTLVVYMGVEQIAGWSADLLAAGKPGDTPVTVVSRCAWPDQQIACTTLDRCAADAARHGWQPPAVVIVGETAQPLAARGPLAGRCVLVTRPAGQGDELAALVRAAGGGCLHVPLVRIEPPESWAALDAAIARADTYDWVVCASANGVRAFVERLRHAGRDARALGTARLAAIGPATCRELGRAGLHADLAPDTFSSEGLVAAFADMPRGGRFLLVRADRGRELLRTELLARGHTVDEVAAYRTLPVEAVDPEILAAVERAGIGWITITSSAIAEAAVRVFGDRLHRWRVASLSPITSATLRRAGIAVAAEASEATAAGLLAAIMGHESVEAGEIAPSAESPQPAR
jgi:uroporphyrinogen III methyltransferase/synthase